MPKDIEEAAQGALLEKDAAKRAAVYEDLQKKALAQSPFVIIFQQTEVAGYSSKLKDFKLGPSFDTNFVYPVSK
ncbi:hypothetical protein D3C80_881460 [compost metagenome]